MRLTRPGARWRCTRTRKRDRLKTFPFWCCPFLVSLIFLDFETVYGNNVRMSDVVQSVRQLLQDFIAPELRELKSDLKQLDAKIDQESKSLRTRMDSDFKRMEDKMDSGFAQMRTLLENAYLRSELEATRDISNLRERVTRLEAERGAPRQ
jgi:hypothetical protein